jgi:hypothetical protein
VDFFFRKASEVLGAVEDGVEVVGGEVEVVGVRARRMAFFFGGVEEGEEDRAAGNVVAARGDAEAGGDEEVVVKRRGGVDVGDVEDGAENARGGHAGALNHRGKETRRPR